MAIEHSILPSEAQHIIHRWKVADETALNAIVPAIEDIDKIALREDNDTYYRLKSVAPIAWVAVGSEVDLSNYYTKSESDSIIVSIANTINTAYNAYELAVQEGFVGSLTDWLNSLKGTDGTNGIDGTDGTDGLSAYQIWLNLGNTGTEQDFIDSLKGDAGATGADGADGVGVPTGGTAGQILAKIDGTDYNTEWIDAPTGSGSGVSTLSALTDTEIVTPANGQALVYDEATQKWVNGDISVVGQLNTDFYQGPYGISWDYSTDTYIRTGAKGYTAIQSMMRRCVLNADGSVNYYLHPDNSNFKEDGTPSVLTGADGNVMVEIPKHYVKVETVGDVDSFSISLTQEPGYVLDPSFMKWNGTEMVEVPYRYFRAYEGFVSGGKLLSVSGVTPTRSQTIATFRTQAMANGTGWHLTDWNLLNTIRRLCYIEFCDFIVTKYLGEGNHIGSDFGITTGQSNALGNRSSNSTHNDKYMSYRGIENMYADIWEFVDGININNYQAYVNQNWSTFASDVFTGDYVPKGPLIAAGASNSLIKRCNVSADGGFIPTIVGGSTTTFYGDAVWSATGAKIAIYGGSAYDGAVDGLGALAVFSASSDSYGSVGAAVCR